jgi:assimilatory nitrate reductase catalytic subunit
VPDLGADWWSARVAVGGGHGALLATDLEINGCAEFAQSLFAGAELAEFQDAERGLYRVAAFDEGRLIGAFFIAPSEEACGWDAVKAMFAAEDLGATERKLLLSGRDASGVADAGPTICACFGVGFATIRDLVISGEASSAEAIGASLKAGTNCGSCVPELRKIVAAHAPKVAA